MMKIQTQRFKEFLNSAIIQSGDNSIIFLKVQQDGICCNAYNMANTNFSFVHLNAAAFINYDTQEIGKSVGIVSPTKFVNALSKLGAEIEFFTDDTYLTIKSGTKEIKSVMANKELQKDVAFKLPLKSEAPGCLINIEVSKLLAYVDFAKLDDSKDYILETDTDKLILKTESESNLIKEEIECPGITIKERVRFKEPFLYSLLPLKDKTVSIVVKTDNPLLIYYESEFLEIKSAVAPCIEN